MFERRTRRSGKKNEALTMLLEAVRERSEISAIALVDDYGRLVCGAGSNRELMILGAVAAPVAHGEMDGPCERLTHGTDVLARRFQSADGETMYLAALGQRVARMSEATRGVARILRAA